MVKKILMIVVPLVLFIGGAFAGDLLSSVSTGDASAEVAAEAGNDEDGDEPSHAAPTQEPDSGASNEGGAGDGEAGQTSFRFPNQFFVPVVRNGRTDSVMIIAATLETAPGTYESVASQEHRLRDIMLRSMMIHANTGGFDGNFTAETSLESLRTLLLKAARDVAGTNVTAVLIEDIARKED